MKLLIALLGVVLSIPASAQTNMDRYQVGGSGTTATSNQMTMRSTIGQPGIGLVVSNSNRHGAGFWYSAASHFTTSTSVDDWEAAADGIPSEYQLHSNYPNPFNPTTTIRFLLPESDQVRVVVYDAIGRIVRTLVDDNLAAGAHKVEWDARDDAGHLVASGIYLYRLEASNFSKTMTMTLLK